MIIQVDLEKVYDRLEWNFIMDTLFDLGILGRLVNIIMKCLSSTSMQICWNGSLSNCFKPSRSVRQRDPLSPYIFVLCMERLSHSISREVMNGRWKPI